MNIRNARWLWLPLLPLLLVLATAAPAWAAGPVTLELQAPENVRLGDQVSVTAVLRDATGAPAPGATIVFWIPASFLSVGGSIELGRATTDAQGRATLLYQARTAEEKASVNAYFPGDSRYEPASATVELRVEGSAQLYQSTAGVQVPGIGVWLLVGILGGVWSTYFAVMVFLALIAREGSKTPSEAEASRA
jgi:hypothetical protein